MLSEIPRAFAVPALADPEVPEVTVKEASAMARAVIRLFDRWQLSDAEAREILGGLSARTYARWKKGSSGRIDCDLATRLSLLMGIHKSLHYLFSDPARGYAWVRHPNRAFDGRRPLDVMLEGSIFSLARLRAYLDA
ncbi:MAG TPA: antitoxin Xre-like helix-turn-helix domain-containing protein [Kiloniellales bacterium]|nr:antitoxin Xre-like helix-turn-helix domain-containing protein [Kiloniellales bacterium]